jgi:hypothetical protein
MGAYGCQWVKETSYHGVDGGCFCDARHPDREQGEAHFVVSQRWRSVAARITVILRAGGRSSTPRPIGSSLRFLEYYRITRLRDACAGDDN